MTADDICGFVGREDASGHPEAREQPKAAILAALRARKGAAVIADGVPQRWRLNETAN